MEWICMMPLLLVPFILYMAIWGKKAPPFLAGIKSVYYPKEDLIPTDIELPGRFEYYTPVTYCMPVIYKDTVTYLSSVTYSDKENNGKTNT